ARTPKTAVAFPMVHDTIPLAGIKSYTKFPQLPSFRLPGFQTPKHNDIVVFNWPTDTVPYFGYSGPLRCDKPVDKKSHYVKRLVGLPGADLSVEDGVVYINNEVLDLGDRAKIQYRYTIYSNKGIDYNFFRKLGYTEHSVTYLTRFQNDEQPKLVERYSIDNNIEKGNRKGDYIFNTYGIPNDSIRAYGLQLQLIPSNKLYVNLTIEDSQNLKKQNLFDSIVKYTL